MMYKCGGCEALIWEIECKGKNNPMGKFCCKDGQVSLLPLVEPPDPLCSLLHGTNAKSKKFKSQIRSYNSVLSFVSLGADIDEKFNTNGGVYSFRMHGSTYHRIGSLLSFDKPKFAQLYIYDTEHELQNRLNIFSDLDPLILESLQLMMHQYNPYAGAFRRVGQLHLENPTLEIKMLICANRKTSRQYTLPIASKVAAIIPGQGDRVNIDRRDIQLTTCDGVLQNISNLHRSYMLLMFVLLFPCGDDGWCTEIPYKSRAHVMNTQLRYVTQREYYAYRLQVRTDTNACLLRGGRLLQQFIVDAYCSIEESRLLWIRNNQKHLRCELYSGLNDMIISNDCTNIEGKIVGRRVVLPSSFTGGPRHMHQLYQDAISIVRCCGKPDLFITFTCNPQWTEITNALLSGQDAQSRPDLAARVFYHKHNDMMKCILQEQIFGKVAGYVSVIEFQKRGLPHSHTLLILKDGFKPNNPSHYDQLVCAELPNKQQFPRLFEIIAKCNVHGPCGVLNPTSPCMIDGKCIRKYPRCFTGNTIVDNSGYPIYMRRDNGHLVTIKGIDVDNRWIVPYNPYLSLHYNAHINVEICSTISAVKYLYKYVYKGFDKATIKLHVDNLKDNVQLDEIQRYLDARYISASEACWRIFEFNLHNEKPDVQHLQVHLPDCHSVIFRDTDTIQDVISNNLINRTSLTEWFTCNATNLDARALLYSEFPEKWVWKNKEKKWERRKRGNTIGRLYFINPSAGDVYFLRMLLTVCKGCTSFEDLRTFNGVVYSTFKETCIARGLIETDNEWSECLTEACIFHSGAQLRSLFVTICVFCEPSSPLQLWNNFKFSMSEDILHSLYLQHGAIEGVDLSDVALAKTIECINDMLKQHGKTILDYGLPLLCDKELSVPSNSLLLEEMMYDKKKELNIAKEMMGTLNASQQKAFGRILHAIDTNKGGCFFIDGPGGSGKTFLYTCLLSYIRGHGGIALASASSGIAALLLPGGRTAHSRFKIPLELRTDSTCNIPVQSCIAQVCKLAKVIIWDEAPMIHRYAFEALDKTLQDIMSCNSLFGGKVVVLGGDFRQILPVILKGRREDIVDATLCKSYIWTHTNVLKLNENMRVIDSEINLQAHAFVKWLLQIGNGLHNGVEEDEIEIPIDMLLEKSTTKDLINWVYSDVYSITDHAIYFRDRAILAATNKDTDMINEITLAMMSGESYEYRSADSVDDEENCFLYSTEFLNSLNLGGGFPPHCLQLKKNVPIMLLRNLDAKSGLCNGTRLICKGFQQKILDVEIITGTHVGKRVFIPRITFIAKDTSLPFTLRRRQFPVRMCFAMTINKAQGQTLCKLGIYLVQPVFTHGQLYVAMSRVRSCSAVKVLLHEQSSSNAHVVRSTTNVVYKDVLDCT